MNIVHSLFMNLCYSVIIHDSINICAPRLRTCRIWPAMATNWSLISKTFWPEQMLSSRLYPAQACICSLRLFRFAVVGGLVEASFSVGYVKSMNCFVSCSVIKVKNITQQIIMIFFRIGLSKPPGGSSIQVKPCCSLQDGNWTFTDWQWWTLRILDHDRSVVRNDLLVECRKATHAI